MTNPIIVENTFFNSFITPPTSNLAVFTDEQTDKASIIFKIGISTKHIILSHTPTKSIIALVLTVASVKFPERIHTDDVNGNNAREKSLNFFIKEYVTSSDSNESFKIESAITRLHTVSNILFIPLFFKKLLKEW